MESLSRRLRAIPMTLLNELEAAHIEEQDLVRRFVEGTASLEGLEQARRRLRQIVTRVHEYLRDEPEREVFAFPRRPQHAASAGH